MSYLFMILGLIAGAFAAGCIVSLVGYIEGRIKGLTLQSLTFMALRWERDYYDKERPGRWKCSFSVRRLGQFFPTITMAPDPSKIKAEDKKKEGPKGSTLAVSIIFVILALAAFGVGLYIAVKGIEGLKESFILGAMCGVSAYLLVLAWIGFGMSGRNGLPRKLQELAVGTADESKLESFVIPPFAHEEYDPAQTVMKLRYATVYFTVAEFKNDLPAMTEAAHELMALGTTGLSESGKFAVDTVLFSFFSFRKIDPEQAEKYYQRSRRSIDNDKDCNGRRKLAYYAFFIKKDRELARKYAQEGLDALRAPDPRMGIVQRNFEEKMLRYLISRLDEETEN